MGRKPAPPSSRGKNATRRPEHAKFTTFVTNVLTRAEVTTPTLLAALVYIDRAKPHLHIGLEQWALERVFLGSLIVASKVCFLLLGCSFFYSEYSAVPKRFNTKERPLGSLYRRLRQTGRGPHRTRVSRRTQFRPWCLRGRLVEPSSRSGRCYHVSATSFPPLHPPYSNTIAFYQPPPTATTTVGPLKSCVPRFFIILRVIIRSPYTTYTRPQKTTIIYSDEKNSLIKEIDYWSSPSRVDNGPTEVIPYTQTDNVIDLVPPFLLSILLFVLIITLHYHFQQLYSRYLVGVTSLLIHSKISFSLWRHSHLIIYSGSQRNFIPFSFSIPHFFSQYFERIRALHLSLFTFIETLYKTKRPFGLRGQTITICFSWDYSVNDSCRK